jgi:hypothetical protein
MGKRAPLQYSTDRAVNQLQQYQAQSLNPLIRNPITNGIILQSVSLAIGTNTIKHNLNRVLQGWHLVRKRANSDIYDEQDSNQNQDKYLVLNSSAQVVVDIYVF